MSGVKAQKPKVPKKAKPGLSKLRLSEFGPFQFGLAKPGLPQLELSKLGPSKLGLSKFGLY